MHKENQQKEPNALLNTRKEKNGENDSTSEREVGFGDWNMIANSDSSLRIELLVLNRGKMWRRVSTLQCYVSYK